VGTIAILTETYKDYNTTIEIKDDCEKFVIVNPLGKENIEISVEPDDIDGDGIIFSFSPHHAHFDADVDSLIGYINHYLKEEYVSVGIYKNDILFSGCSHHGDIDTSSGEAILRSITRDSPYYHGSNTTMYQVYYEQLKGCDVRCSIRGWNGTSDKDFNFVL